MANAVLKGALALGVAGAVVVGAPYALGLAFESKFKETIAKASAQSPYPIKLVSYQRGVFSAAAETVIEIPLPPDPAAEPAGKPEIQRFTLLHAISHGPRLDGLRSGRIVSTPKFEGAFKTEMDSLFGTQMPLTITTDIGFAGSAFATIVSPAVMSTIPADGDAPAQQVNWSGLSGGFKVRGQKVIGQLAAPGLTMKSPDLELSIANTSLNADLSLIGDGPLSTGTAGLAIASVSMTGGPGSTSSFKLSGLDFQSDTTEKDGLMHSGVSFSASRIEAADTVIDKPTLRLAFEKLDTVATEHLSEVLNRYSADQANLASQKEQAETEEDLRKLLAELKPYFGALAAAKPELNISELSFTGPQGAVMFTGGLRYIGSGNFEQFSPVTDLEGDANLDAPLAVVDLMLREKSRSEFRSEAGDPQAEIPDEVLQQASQNSLSFLVNRKLLAVDGDRATSKVEFKAGVLTVNGQRLDAGGS